MTADRKNIISATNSEMAIQAIINDPVPEFILSESFILHLPKLLE